MPLTGCSRPTESASGSAGARRAGSSSSASSSCEGGRRGLARPRPRRPAAATSRRARRCRDVDALARRRWRARPGRRRRCRGGVAGRARASGRGKSTRCVGPSARRRSSRSRNTRCSTRSASPKSARGSGCRPASRACDQRVRVGREGEHDRDAELGRRLGGGHRPDVGHPQVQGVDVPGGRSTRRMPRRAATRRGHASPRARVGPTAGPSVVVARVSAVSSSPTVGVTRPSTRDGDRRGRRRGPREECVTELDEQGGDASGVTPAGVRQAAVDVGVEEQLDDGDRRRMRRRRRGRLPEPDRPGRRVLVSRSWSAAHAVSARGPSPCATVRSDRSTTGPGSVPQGGNGRGPHRRLLALVERPVQEQVERGSARHEPEGLDERRARASGSSLERSVRSRGGRTASGCASPSARGCAARACRRTRPPSASRGGPPGPRALATGRRAPTRRAPAGAVSASRAGRRGRAGLRRPAGQRGRAPPRWRRAGRRGRQRRRTGTALTSRRRDPLPSPGRRRTGAPPRSTVPHGPRSWPPTPPGRAS